MTLYIKQKIWSFSNSFDIMDANQNVVYTVKSEVWSLLPKYHIKAKNERELMLIKKKMTFMWANYELFQGNEICATIKQNPKLLKSSFTVESPSGTYEISGDFWSMDFSISLNGRHIGAIHKKFMTWADTYEIVSDDDADILLLCAMAIVTDDMFHNESTNTYTT